MNRITKTMIGVGIGIAGAGAMIAMTSGPGSDHAHAPEKARVGHAAPNFLLADQGKVDHELKEILDAEDTNAVVLEWFNPECPVVKGHYRKGTMGAVQEMFEGQGVVWLRINSGG